MGFSSVDVWNLVFVFLSVLLSHCLNCQEYDKERESILSSVFQSVSKPSDHYVECLKLSSEIGAGVRLQCVFSCLYDQFHVC